jgi:hypothetical protein
MEEFTMRISVFLLACLLSISQICVSDPLQSVPQIQAFVIESIPEPLNLVNTVNWTESVDTIYAGLMYGKTNISDMVSCINNMTNWQDVLRWTARCRKFGSIVENEGKIKWALDTVVMLSDGSLPSSIGSNTSSDFYSVYDGEFMYGYYYANLYSYDLSKWNVTLAYDNFKQAYVNTGHGFLEYYNTACTLSITDRYYDEEAQSMRVFLLFYQLGNISSALWDAETVWTYLNNHYWTSDFYSYTQRSMEWECEFGGFLQLASWLSETDRSVSDMSRLVKDIVNRFLTQRWDSPQWNGTYVCVHASTNNQTRLENTIMSWTALFSINNLYDYTTQQCLIDLLSGHSGLDPAWKLLRSSNASLFDTSSEQFRWHSNSAPSNLATAYGCLLSFLLCIVPINATLAVPIEELHYQYIYNMLDYQLFNISLTSRTVTISIFKSGTIEFIFNGTTYQSFPKNGTYQIVFNPDWSSINSTTRISDLPTNRLYVADVAFDNEAPMYDSNAIEADSKLAGSICNFSCQWHDDVGLSGFIFEHNNTGTLENETWLSFDSLELGNSWSYASLTLNDTANTVIEWRFYANDTSNNWNGTMSPQYLTVKPVVHDVAVTNVVPAKAVIGLDLALNVSVTVANIGDCREAVNVTTYANMTPVGPLSSIDLASNESSVVIFAWNTSGFDEGNYVMSAYAELVPNETDLSNNNYTDGVVTVAAHDIAVTNITFSNEYSYVNDIVTVYVTVQNNGANTENFTTSVNYTLVNETMIGTQAMTLAQQETAKLNFTWMPTIEGLYMVKACTSEILGDPSPEDNTLVAYLYAAMIEGGTGCRMPFMD